MTEFPVSQKMKFKWKSDWKIIDLTAEAETFKFIEIHTTV